MDYIAFIKSNPDSSGTRAEWESFFVSASKSGMFRGESELGKRYPIGTGDAPETTDQIDGFMRFESATLGPLADLLKSHPVILHGGAIELREMPSL